MASRAPAPAAWIVAMALLFAACGPEAPATSVASSGPTLPASATRGQGGTLRLLFWQAVTVVNPHLAQGKKDFLAASLVLEPLAHWGPDGTPIPALATEIPTVQNGGISSDLTAVTWKLRPGVKWSDGTAFTASDVVFTFRFVTESTSAAVTRTAADPVKSVQAIDPLTVRVTYKEPTTDFYAWGVGPLTMILQERQFGPYLGDRAKDAPGNQAPIGTGPYKVRESKPNDVVAYELNDQYRDPTKPFFKEVMVKGGGDAATAARAVFQTGETDYAWNLQIEAPLLRALVDDPASRGVLVSAVSPNTERLSLNRADPSVPGDPRSEPTTRHPFLSDLRVRTALAMAVDRRAIAATLYGDGVTGEATCNVVVGVADLTSPNTQGFDACRFDVAAANRLLDEAGWIRGPDGVRAKNGVRMRLVFQTTVSTLRQKEQEIVKEGWQKLGIAVELKAVSAGVFFGRDGNDTAAKFFADVQMYTTGAASPDPTLSLGNWRSDQVARRTNDWSGTNYERFQDPDYDDLFAQLRRATDPAKRRDLIIKLNDVLVKDVVVIPLVARRDPLSGAAKGLKGIVANTWDVETWNIADWRY